MKEQSSTPKPPVAGKWRWVKWPLGAFLVLLLAPVIWLATPYGQRVTVRFVVEHINDALPATEDPIQVSVEGIGVDRLPLGIALQGLAILVDEPGGDTLVQVNQISLQPEGLDVNQWRSIEIEGIRGSNQALDRLENWFNTSEDVQQTQDQAVDLHFQSIRISDLLWNFDTMADAPLQPSFIALKRLDLVHLDREDGTWTLGNLQASLEVMATSQEGLPLGYSVLMNGDHTQWACSGQRQEGPVPVLDGWGTRWCPDNWTLGGDLNTGGFDVRVNNPEMSAQVLGAWSPDTIGLERIELKTEDMALWIPEWPSSSAELMLDGPLRVPLDSAAMPKGTWGGFEVTGDLSCRGNWVQPSGETMASSGHWSPNSGAMALTLDVTPGFFSQSQGHGPSINIQGTLPVWGAPFNQMDAQGTWELNHLGTETGLTAKGGTLAWTALQDSAGGWSTDLSLSALMAPLDMGNAIELNGPLEANAHVELDATGQLLNWKGGMDITGSQWVPRETFGLQIGKSAPPLAMKKFTLDAFGDQQRFNAELDGDFLRGSVQGPLSVEHWFQPFELALASGGFGPRPSSLVKPKDWSIKLKVLRDDLLERWSRGSQSVGPYSQILASNVDGELSVDLKLSALHVGPVKTRRLHLNGTGSDHSLTADLNAQRIQVGNTESVEALSMKANVDLDERSHIDLEWTGPVEGEVALIHHMSDEVQHVVTPTLASFRHASGDWNMSSGTGAKLTWQDTDWRSLRMDSLDFTGALGTVTFGGADSSQLESPNFSISLDGVPLGPLSEWTSETLGAEYPLLKGNLNGHASLDLRREHATANLQWQDAAVNEFDFGDLCLAMNWSDHFEGQLQQFFDEEEKLTAEVTGPHSASIQMNGWPLDVLNPILSKGDVHIEGLAQGKVAVDWSSGLPLPKGRLAVEASNIKVGATGGQHGIRGDLILDSDFIGMDQAVVTDRLGNTALLNLSVLHSDYTSWNYDLGLLLDNGPFMAIELPPSHTGLFYGTVMATGSMNVFGDEEGLFLEAEVQSEVGTSFTLPLDALEGADMPSGIRFVGGPSSAPPPPSQSPFGLTLNLELDVTPEAELALVLDSEAGERIDGLAQGHLAISMSPEWPLSVQGGLNIVQGQYRFSLRDLFTKTIDIAQGGRIDWDGDPYSAELSVLAVSNMMCTPTNLLQNEGLGQPSISGNVENQRTKVEVGMDIQGQLTAPLLNFSLTFPELEAFEPSLLARVNSVLSTPGETERQAFALLATGGFIGGQTNSNSNTNSLLLEQTAVAQASELVSSRISEMLSGLSEDLDIGLRYVPSSETGASSGGSGSAAPSDIANAEDAFQLDLGMNLINNRLRISGSLGARGMDGFSMNEESEFMGRLDVRYKLTPDGRWELMGYQKPESTLEDGMKMGIGAAYQIRFDHFRDLFRSDRP